MKIIGLAVLGVLGAQMTVTAPSVSLQCASNQVGKYQKIEFTIGLAGSYTNPFDPDEVEVNLRITSEAGRAIIVPAFYCQDYERRQFGADGRLRDWMYPTGLPGWRARFAPTETGRYEAVCVVKDRQGTNSSNAARFSCVPSGNRGFVRVSRKDPRFLELSEGQAFFPIGQNLAFIGSQQYVTLAKAESIFQKLAANGANYLRMWTCCEDWAMAIEARKSAWGRSWDWQAPVVPMPDSAGAERKCLKLSGVNARLRIQPSHPVALRPNQQYVLSGRVRTEGDARLRPEGSLLAGRPDPVASPGGWKPFRFTLQTGPNDYWLPEMSLRPEGAGTVWVGELSLRETEGGPELLWEADVNRPHRGTYNPLDCFMLDEVLAAAEHAGIYLQVCLVTRDLYMDALKDPGSPEYDRAIQDARKLFRYAVARWGYSTSVAAWEYWNEMNPGLPTDRFYMALGEYLEQVDLYHHLRTTSTWGPSAKDCRHAKLDFADTHFYLRPSDKGRLEDEVDAVIERTRWLREQAPQKPAHLGEFGLATEKWGPTAEMQQSPELVDFHNALWASALSGASTTAMFWWWERLDQRNGYPIYQPLSRFLADVPWTSGDIRPVDASCTDARLRAIGLQAKGRSWLWLFNREASWAKVVIEKRSPALVAKAQLNVKSLPEGSYRISWWDTQAGKSLAEEKLATQNGALQLSAPPFNRDIACRIERAD